MHLCAFQYHTDLTAEQRHAVDAWLALVLGDDWPKLRVWNYEVVGEGVIEFTHFVVRRDFGLDIETFTRTTAVMPPVLL